MAFVNTNTRINQFIEHGFTKEQAEFLVEKIPNEDSIIFSKEQAEFKDSTKIQIDIEVIKRTMATKEDVTKLESKIESINTNIKWIMAIGLLIVGILLKSTFIH